MADAKKCDRCGKLYEHYDGIRVVENDSCYHIMRLENDTINTRVYDMCPECMQKLVDFIKEESES